MSALRMRSLTFALALAATAACGDRPDAWDTPVGKPRVYGMQTAVAVIDDPTHRVTFFVARPGQELDRSRFDVGHGVVHADVSPDKSALFVLALGDLPRKSVLDQRPSLSVLTRKDGIGAARRFELSTPLSGLAIDPLGRYVAAYAGGVSRASFVENPNEIVLVDLEAPEGRNAPVTRTLRSFGGRPQRLTFTPVLNLPGGPRRLLIVESEQDVTLLDLDHLRDVPERPEITVRLTTGSSSRALVPAAVVVDDGDPARNDDARIAVRLANDPNVVTLTLAPASPPINGGPLPPNDFSPKINLTDVGGIATDVAFVRTDGGLRIAALVPSRSAAVLVEPETSITTDVTLSDRFQKLSLITSVVGSPAAGTDVALLYGGSASSATSSGVAFWSLGKTSDQPYRSVEVLSISGNVSRVLNVPLPHPELKVLETSGNAFYVLNLLTRTATPLTTVGAAALELSQDGERLWAFQRGGTNLAAISLGTIHPTPVYLDRTIDGVFDINRDDGGRALVAVHATGTFGATVFDAQAPDSATGRSYAALLLEGF